MTAEAVGGMDEDTPAGGPAVLGVWTEEELEAVLPGGCILPLEGSSAYPPAVAPYVRAALLRSLVVRGDLLTREPLLGFHELDSAESDALDAPLPGDAGFEEDKPEETLEYAWGEAGDEEHSMLAVSPESPLALVIQARTHSERAVVVEVRTPGWTSSMGYLGGPGMLWMEEALLEGAVRRFALHRLDDLLAGLLDDLGLREQHAHAAAAQWLELRRDVDGRLDGAGATAVQEAVDTALHLLTVESATVGETDAETPVRLVLVSSPEQEQWLLLGPPGEGPVLAAPAASVDPAVWLRAAFTEGFSMDLPVGAGSS